ncbi:MAG: hypothetical protein WCQ00_02740 [bacterium]
MNSNNQLYKKNGILLGVVAVLAVVIVTYSQEKTSSNVAVDTSTQQSTSEVSNNVVANNQTSDDSESDDDNTQAPSNTIPAVVTTQVGTTKKGVSTNNYKNGTYTADGTYGTPDGDVTIRVSLTIANNIITDSNVTSVSGDRTSVRYQEKFISGYKQYVIGKNIADLKLSKVSGSSLTPEGFNKALSSIKTQAAA